MNYEKFSHNSKDIFLVDMRKERNPYVSELAFKGIEKMISQNKRVLLLRNKKGYANGLMCRSCGHIHQCRHCDVSIVYHKTSHQDFGTDYVGLCHICKTQYDYYSHCQSCQSEDIFLYGMGMEKLVEYCTATFNVPVCVVDARKVSSQKKIETALDDMQKSSIVISTGILVQPPIKDMFSLVIVGSADGGLHTPDYTSADKTFWFIYEPAQKYTCPLIVQTHNPSHASIRAACALNLDAHTTSDTEYRKKNMYPPFGDFCMLLYKHEIEKSLHTKIDTVHKELLYLVTLYNMNINVYATPPLVYKMFGKYRYSIILSGQSLREFVDIVFSKLRLTQRGFKIDRQAENLF